MLVIGMILVGCDKEVITTQPIYNQAEVDLLLGEQEQRIEKLENDCQVALSTIGVMQDMLFEDNRIIAELETEIEA
jgi:hypothetical protein